MNDSHIQTQAYNYFLAEAPELLQTIEQEILTLPSDRTTAKVHNLMRALHTLKGAAANVGLTTIERIAHHFEDVTRVFYDLTVEIDVSIQSLLLDGYAGLDECLNAQVTDTEIDEIAILDRIDGTLAQLKLKLGDWSEIETTLPTSIELGFDIVASIFETTIQEQIDAIIHIVETKDPNQIAECLHQVTDTCISLAESFELPGFLDINRAIIAAVSHHPDRVEEIAVLALVNLQQAQTEVLAGDRTLGGTIIPDLADLAENRPTEPDVPQVEDTQEIAIVVGGEAELPAFQAFLTSDRFRKRQEFSNDNQRLFNQIIRLCWDWFRHEIQPPQSQLNLELLVTTDGLADLDYIHHWIGLLLQGLSKSSNGAGENLDRGSSFYLYRQCCIYQVIFAVAKYLAGTEPHPQLTPEFLTELRLYLQALVDTYKQGSPVTINERGWIDRIILPHHWTTNLTPNLDEDLLLTEIWGKLDLDDARD
jgi:two-component system, chemotaxis family, sensor histidine kinase and response regulator PixL